LGIFPEGARYRKHFLELGGLGVRDLCPDGDDLLVLAGPTMALSGPVRVHRWRAAAAAGPVVREAQLPVETVVTHGEGTDHAEGITLLGSDPRDPRARLLVVYDLPGPARRPWPDTLLADRVRIGDGAAAEITGESTGAGTGEPPGRGDGADDLPDELSDGLSDGLSDETLPDDGISDDEFPAEPATVEPATVEPAATEPAPVQPALAQPEPAEPEPEPVRPW
jgi:hypothetical protein